MFMDKLNEELNITTTENGDKAYKSTLDPLLDLVVVTPNLNKCTANIQMYVNKAYRADKENTLKALFYLRDIYKGAGERTVFRAGISEIARLNGEHIVKNLEHIKDFGRFDDLLCLLDTPIKDEVIRYIGNQLVEDVTNDIQGRPVSLLAKWLPSINTSSSETRRYGRMICKGISIPEGTYRKVLSKLRKKINIVERHISNKDFDFDYSHVPSLAMSKYRNLFFDKDGERFTKYMNDVAQGKAKINTKALYPHNIISTITNEYGFRYSDLAEVPEEMINLYEQQWKNLPNFDIPKNSLVVLDGSGSMYDYDHSVAPIDIATSLALYTAERCSGEFKNKFITFSSNPQLVEITGDNIVEKLRNALAYNEVASTDLRKTFEVILKTAIKHNLTQEQLPSCLFVISDMQFDSGVNYDESSHETIKREFEEHGYQLPKIVYWNVESGNTLPVPKDEYNTVLVSGKNPSIFEYIGSISNPLEFLMNILNSDRYKCIQL